MNDNLLHFRPPGIGKSATMVAERVSSGSVYIPTGYLARARVLRLEGEHVIVGVPLFSLGNCHHVEQFDGGSYPAFKIPASTIPFLVAPGDWMVVETDFAAKHPDEVVFQSWEQWGERGPALFG